MGGYQIVAPYLKSYFSVPKHTGKMMLEMSLSQKGSHLWARFDFDNVSGVMRSCGSPPRKVGDVCRFIWRGQEEGEGEICYGEDNWFSITFLGDGRIKGAMHWTALGTFEFIGKKIKEQSAKWAQNVASWKDEWRGMNEHNYGFVRWGGGSSPDEFDTSKRRYVTPRSDTDGDLSNGYSSEGWMG